MITSLDFERVKYPKPKLSDDRPKLSNILGLDSEAYTTGAPFMFCLSNGDTLLPRDIPHVFFEPRYASANFVIYNMKYDSGALLYHLPRENLLQLWEEGKTAHNGFRYKYIPHKLLRIFQSKNAVSFWDISQFYKSSLDRAAKTYLGRGKRKIRTKSFTPAYVSRNFQSVRKYCIEDARLTGELGRYLVDKLEEFGIVASTLYSSASISFTYFINRSRVVTALHFWKHYKHALEYACDAYAGGKFEVTARGSFADCREYDITSAYPYEIADLVDISNASVVFSSSYQRDAVYGFLRVRIRNYAGKHLPCGMKRKDGSVYYPAGVFCATITKAEYEYLQEIEVPVDIHSAYWLFVPKPKKRPYRRCIKTLFALKDRMKGKDRMLYNTSKIVMNGFYGKMAQCIEQHDGSVLIGAGWNPIYAAVITANTRIQVTRIQNLLGDRCLAVHTDSVMTLDPIPQRFITGKIGGFEFVVRGRAVIIACGMYAIDNQGAYKGFIPDTSDTWEAILTRYKYRKTIPYRQLHVESWLEAMAKNHPKNRINVFARTQKRVDLNCDTKRLWPSRINGLRLLTENEQSLPVVVSEGDFPSHWKIDPEKICGINLDSAFPHNV